MMTTSGRLQSWLSFLGKSLLGLLILTLCSGCAYNLFANRAMNKEVTRHARNPDSMVIKGCEAVTLQGTSPNAILLVHGFVGSRTDYNDLGSVLNKEGLTVRMLRLPGHGTYPVDQANTTAEELLQAVRMEYRALKREHPQVALAGFSMGGALSTITASMDPVDRLILIGPYYGVTYRWYYGLPAEAWNGMFSWLIPYVVKGKYFTCVNRPEAKPLIFNYEVISTRAAGELMKLGRTARSEETLSKVQCPVLMLHSWGDRAASPKQAEKAFEKIGSTDKRIVWYEKSNHHLLWDYEREAVKREIIQFLQPLTAKSPPR